MLILFGGVGVAYKDRITVCIFFSGHTMQQLAGSSAPGAAEAGSPNHLTAKNSPEVSSLNTSLAEPFP